MYANQRTPPEQARREMEARKKEEKERHERERQKKLQDSRKPSSKPAGLPLAAKPPPAPPKQQQASGQTPSSSNTHPDSSGVVQAAAPVAWEIDWRSTPGKPNTPAVSAAGGTSTKRRSTTGSLSKLANTVTKAFASVATRSMTKDAKQTLGWSKNMQGGLTVTNGGAGSSAGEKQKEARQKEDPQTQVRSSCSSS